MSKFDKAFVNITPEMGYAIMLQAFGGAYLQTISYQKVEDTTDSITRLLVTGKMESMVHPFACDFFHLTDLEPVEYSFLLQGKNADGTELSLSFKETPKKSVETPELVSLVGMESQLKAEIKLKTENEGGMVVFFLVDADGTIIEYRHQIHYVSLEEVHEVIISNAILPQGQTFEVSFLMEAQRGPTAMTSPVTITMANKPDRIIIFGNDDGDGLEVDKPDDYAEGFVLDVEASKFSVVDTSDSEAMNLLLTQVSSAHHERSTYVGGLVQSSSTMVINHSWEGELIGSTSFWWNGTEYLKGPKVTALGQRENNGDRAITFESSMLDYANYQMVVFVRPVLKLTAAITQRQVDGDEAGPYLISAEDLTDMAEYVNVRARWTNADGSSDWSSDLVIRRFSDEYSTDDLKVVPSIAEKILSFKVEGRDADKGIKLIGAVGESGPIVQYANKVDGRIVLSLPADQDLSAISASQAISAKLVYQWGPDAQFYGQLNIPRIEAGEVSIEAKEVLSPDGGEVEYDFIDTSSYIDGASRTSVTINDTAIIHQDVIPANTSGSTDFQLKSVQYSLPSALIVPTASMDGLSGIADWQSLPIKQVEVFGKDLTLDGPLEVAVGDFFINFDLSVKLDEFTFDRWVEKTDQEKVDMIAGLDAAYGAKEWYTSPTLATLNNVPLKYEDGELYFVEVAGKAWSMYYEAFGIKRTNMSGAVSDGQLTLPVFGGRKVWSTTTLYNGQQAPVPLAEHIESFPARKFILDRTVQTHTAVSPPTAATIAISANGLEGEVIASITPGATGNQTLESTLVRYTDENNTTYFSAYPSYSVAAGPGVRVTAVVFDNYSYTKADGSVFSHVVTSGASEEAHGVTAPILGTPTIQDKKLSIPYKSGGKIGTDHNLSLFVFAHDADPSSGDLREGQGSFHVLKTITPGSLTAEVTYEADFSNFSSSISKYMIVLSRPSDDSSSSKDNF